MRNVTQSAMTHRRLITILSFLLCFCPLWGEIRLPEVFSDNMVLQQNTSVNIWGWADAGSKVVLSSSWSKKKVEVVADDSGYWVAAIPTAAASFEPQSLVASECRGSRKISTVQLENVLLGEVWFTTGQSNMELFLGGEGNCPIENGNEAIATCGKYKGIRFCKVPRRGYSNVQETVEGKWMESNSTNAPIFSAISFFFAKYLTEVLDIPIGIVGCSYGGTTLEGWLPEKKLLEYEDIDLSYVKSVPANVRIDEWVHPEIMYNAMLHPLAGYTARGFLWYQGEGNVSRYSSYSQRLKDMVEIWKDDWKSRNPNGQSTEEIDQMPFYIVEIAPCSLYGGMQGTWAAFLREQQYIASKQIPNSGLVSTNDLVYPYETCQIHPRKKEEVGQRLAFMALNKTYGHKNVVCEGPVYSKIEIKDASCFRDLCYCGEGGKFYGPFDFDGKCAEIYFDNVEEGLSPFYGLTGFEIAGADRSFKPAQAVLFQPHRSVVVWSEEVAEPVAVRYCFRDWQVGNLTNYRLLPCVPFRTDNWN